MQRMKPYVPRWILVICPFITIAIVASLPQNSESETNHVRDNSALTHEEGSSLREHTLEANSTLPTLPYEFPDASADGHIYVKTKDGTRRQTTLDPILQSGMDQYIKQNGNPIAAVVIADAKTGKILAMAQGQHYESLGKPEQHTALDSGFPAASLFKNVTTAASLEVAEVNEDDGIGLVGGCSDVHTRGVWLNEVIGHQRDPMTMRTAYGKSCNGFYAKLAVNYAGLGAIITYAHRFGWGRVLPTDFALTPSPFLPPNPTGSSIHTVGRFAAGFGPVGLSASHGAWYSLAMANDGQVKSLTIFADSPEIDTSAFEPLFTAKTGGVFRGIMSRTPNGGTATATYRKAPFRHLASMVGGKTGTLIGNSPRGLTTWFTGMMPLDDPKVVVAAIVIAGDRWLIKGTQLAAEGFRQWNELHLKNIALNGPVAGNENLPSKLH